MLEHEKMQKNCYLFGVTHCAHESESKNFIQPRNKVWEEENWCKVDGGRTLVE